MTATSGAINDSSFFVEFTPLPDQEVDRLAGIALKDLLNNRMAHELQTLLDDFGAYGATGIDTIVEHFNEQLGRFWSPYRLRVSCNEDGTEITVKLMRMENGKLNPSGPIMRVTPRRL